MSKKLELKIITPEKLVFQEIVDQVTFPTTAGELTILPEHIPIVASLSSGDIVAMVDGEHIPMAVSGGFVEIKKENDITIVAILADFAEHIGTITDEEIAKAKARSEELRKLAQDKSTVDYEHFAAELERSLTRVKIADKWRSKKYRK